MPTSSLDLDPALRALCGADVPLGRGARVHDGTRRSRPIADTLASLTARIGALGITRVFDVTPLDRIAVPVWNACVPNARTECYTAGKGLTREASLVSALMEAFELRAALARQPRHELRARTAAEVAAIGDVVSPAELALPIRVDLAGDERHDWMRCLALGTGQQVYLPADLFSFAYGEGGAVRSVRRLGTNGLASGNSAYEALAHGLYELVERDALVLSNFGPSRALDLARAPLGSELAGIVARIARAGVELYVFDITSDVELPTYQAYLTDACGFASYHLHSGSGCHHDAEVALARAITEACQVRLTYFVGAREDVADAAVGESVYRALRRCHAEAEAVALRAGPTPDDLAEAVAAILDRLAAIGCPDVYAAELALEGFEQVAMRCYVPGLEGPYRDAAGDQLVGPRGWARRESVGPRRFGF